MKKIEVEWISPDKLSPWDLNPRKNEKAVDAVIASIEDFGFNVPILVDQNLRICAGHTRWLAAKELAMDLVPIVKKDLTEDEFIALNLADNKTAEISKWDKKKLKACMEILGDLKDISVPGFSDSEIDGLFGAKTEIPEGDTIDQDEVIRSLSFKFSGKDHRIISNKLKAIKKAQGFETTAEALHFALKPFKASADPIIRKGEAK